MRMTRKRRKAMQKRQMIERDLRSAAAKSAYLTAGAMLLWNTTSPAALAMPTGGQVAAGQAAIHQAGTTMTIAQQTARAILNWRSFGILPNEQVNFIQPGKDAVALNRVLGNDPSAIFGKLTANGRVFLVNPNGVFFAPGARVDVGGMVATTLSITDADFMNGKYVFRNDGKAQNVLNQGTIAAQEQGLVALLAPEVKNEGVIIAKKGAVALAAGDQVTLDYVGDGRIQLAVDAGALRAAAENKGLIEADGGIVLMTAKGDRELTSSVVNQSGVVRARSLDGKTGAVALDAAGGAAVVNGTVDVSGTNVYRGGTFDAFGKEVTLTEQSRVDASGKDGGYVRIGGDWQGTGDAPHADRVTIARGATVRADARDRGDGGAVVVWSDGATQFDGAITARGGARGGDGGQVETSGHVLQATGSVDASAANGQGGAWLLDPADIVISGDATNDVTHSGNDFAGGTQNSVLNVDALNSALNNNTNVTVKTDGGSGGTGHITVNGAITAAGGATLTLQADGNIIVNQNVSAAAGKALNVDLLADYDANGGGKIEINSGAAITTNGGWVKLRGKTDDQYAYDIGPSGTGAKVAGTIDAGAGKIEIYGYGKGKGIDVTGKLIGGDILLQGKSDGSGVGIELSALSGSESIQAKNLTLIGDKMNWGSSSGVVKGTAADSVLMLQTLSAGKTIGLGGGAGDLQIAALTPFTGFGKLQVGKADAGAITVGGGGLNFTGDVTLQTGGAIALNGALTATGKTVTLQSAGGVSGAGVVTAGTLDLETGTVNLTGTQAIGALVGKTGGVTLTNGQALTVGTVKGLQLGGAGKLTTTAGDITVGGAVSGAALTLEAKNAIQLNGAVTSNNGAVKLTAQGGGIGFGSGGKIAAGSGAVELKAQSLDMTSAQAKAVAGKTLLIDHSTANGGLTIGSSSGGLHISAASFGASGAFGGPFDTITLGATDSAGAVQVGEALTANGNLIVNGGTVAFGGDSSALQTANNKNLTVNAATKIDFGSGGQFAAQAGAITLRTDAVDNWSNASFAGSGGKLAIEQHTANKALQIGAVSGASGSPLAVTQDGLTKIAAGNFQAVTIGKGTGAVALGAVTATPARLTINGGAGTLTGAVANAADQTLTLNLASLAQQSGGSFNLLGGLLLNGSGAFTLTGSANTIGALAADVGSLTLDAASFGVGAVDGMSGVTASGAIAVKADKITALTQPLKSTGGTVMIRELTGADGIVVNKAGTGAAGQLALQSAWFGQWISAAGGITLGGKDYEGSIRVGDAGQTTTFLSKLNLWTKQTNGLAVDLLGRVNVGNAAPWQDLYIYSWSASLPDQSSLYVKDLTLELAGGLGGFASGSKIYGGGNLNIAGPSSGDIYISDTHSGDYVIGYGFLNDIVQGFAGFEVKNAQNIIMDAGTLEKSLKLTGTGGASEIKVNGAVAIGGEDVAVTLTGKKFSVADSAGLSLTGSGGIVKATADETTLGANAGIHVGSGSLILTTDKLTAGSGAAVDGAGDLTIQQRGDVGLTIGQQTNVSSASGLVITQEQLNGGLFGGNFANLTLGNAAKDQTISITGGVTLQNNVAIQTGGGANGKIAVAGGDLTISGANADGTGRRVTLRGGVITNGDSGTNHAIDVGTTGTIHLRANTLDLHGSGQVKGSGTLGIGTYDGSKAIYLGDGYTSGGGNGLYVGNNFFSGGAFADTFSAYSIGSADQAQINVKGAQLGKNLTLTGKNIAFAGNLTLNGGEGKNDLTLRASEYAGQITKEQADANITNQDDGPQTTGSKLAVHDLVLDGATAEFNLNSSANEIGGTLRGDGKLVNVASQALTVGAITTHGSDLVLSADTMDFTGANLQAQGHGILTLQQLNAATPLQIGGASNAGSGLWLPKALFDSRVGPFDGGVYLGLQKGTAQVTLTGELNFANDTYIRAAGGSGSVVVGDGAQVKTADKKFTVWADGFQTLGNAQIDSGGGDLTLRMDTIDLSGTSSIHSDGAWTLKTFHETDAENYAIWLGGSGTGPGPGNGYGLWLKKSYFNEVDGATQVFHPGTDSVIHFGSVDAKAQMTQTESIDFANAVVIDQGKNGGKGFVIQSGANITTGGKDYAVNSQHANFNHVTVDAGAGKISLNADYYTLDGAKFKGGGITLDTYTASQQISFGAAGEGQAGVLGAGWFTDGTFAQAGPITIGSADNTGGIKLTGDFATNHNLNLVTGGAITSDSTANWNFKTHNLSMESSSIEVTNGVLANVGTLTAHSPGAVHIDNANHTIAKLGDIAGAGVSIKDLGGLEIAGTVTSTGGGNDVDIWTTGGNLVVGSAGKVASGKDIYLTAENAHFMNNNTGAANAVLTAGGRWVIFTEDSLGDQYGNLTGDFRRYHTAYGDKTPLIDGTHALTPLPDYSGSGSAHVKNPQATLSAEKVYGESYLEFFTNHSLKLEIEGGQERIDADQAFLQTAEDLLTGMADSSSYTLSGYFTQNDGRSMQVNKDIHGTPGNNTTAYGTGHGDADKNATYKESNNPLNYNVQTQFWVTPKKVKVTANDSLNNTYDGRYKKPTGVTYSGWVSSESENVITGGNLSFLYGGSADGQRNVKRDAAGNVVSYDIQISGTGSNLIADNYVFEYVNGQLKIDPRAITVTTDNAHRAYGDDNPANLSGKVADGSSLGAGDTIESIGVAVSGVGKTSNVGTYSGAVQVNSVVIDDGNGGGNYTVSYANGDLTVDKRQITVTAVGDKKIYGDSNPALDQTKFTVGGNGLVNGDAIATIDRTLDGSIGQFTNAGTYKEKVLAKNAHFSSGAADNYDITYVGGDFTIDKRQLVITAGDITRVYGDANPALQDYMVGAFGAGTGLVNGDEVGSVTLAYDAAINPQTHAGRYDAVISASDAALSQGELNNYDVQYVKGNVTVTPRQITVSATGGEREYGAANPSQLGGKVTAGNLVNGDTLGAVTVSTAANQYSDVGDYAVTPNGVEFSQGLAADYAIDYVNGTLKVTKKKVTVTANDAGKAYDGLGYIVGTHGVHYDGFVNGQNEQVISGGALHYGGAADGAKNAGSYGISLTGDLAAQNYDFDYEHGTLNITKKTVTVTANSYDKTYDGQAYHSGGGYRGDQVRYDGFVAGEDLGKITGGDVRFGGAAQNAVDAGQYEIALDGSLTAQNYDFDYRSGALDVKKKTVVVTANNDSKVYDGNAYTGGNGIFSYVGFIGGDSAANALTGGSIVYGSGDAVGAIDVGNYVIGIQSSDLMARNYDFTYVDGKLDITKKKVTVTANDFSKVYDGIGYVAGSHGARYDGFVGGQDESVISGGSLHYGGAADGAKDVRDGGYQIDLTGDLTAKNYDFDYESGTLIVTPKRLVVAVNDDRKPQDGIPYRGGNGVRYDGFVAGDNESVLGGALVYGGGAQGATDVGNYDITADGLSAQNYTIDYAPGNLQIYTQGIDTAVDTVQNVTQLKVDADAAETAPDTVINKRPEPQPSLMGDIDPNVPALNIEGMVSIVDIEAAKDFPQGNMDLQVQGSAENHHLYADRSGFGIVFEGGAPEGFDPAHSKTDGAIPFLFTDSKSLGTDHEQTLEGFYAVSCTPEKLSIQPAPQGETTPRRSEIGEPELRQDYGVAYQEETAGSFQVGISNGIVTIQPKDDAAVETVNSAAKAPQRAVLAAGVLRAIRDFGVAPDQLRAVYVFRDKQVLGAQARKG